MPLPAKTFYGSFKDTLTQKKKAKEEYYVELEKKKGTEGYYEFLTKNDSPEKQASLRQRPNSAKMQAGEEAPLLTRPSAARWVELSSTRGTYEKTKLKVMEIRK